MENSEKFAHNYDFKYPGLYEFFQNNVFEGREYENYQCVSGCPGINTPHHVNRGN